jgi:ATP-dependent Clp protease ATP-binding subunit ClpA
LREALLLKDKSIGTEHILLGLLRNNTGSAAALLTDAGVNANSIRERLVAYQPP